jgi:drug/metabolite transporter (DMT)-like permease
VRAVVEVLLVAVGYAVAPFIAERRLADVPSLGVIATSLAGVFLLYLVPAALTAPDAVPSAEAVGSLFGLAVLCTAIAFVVFFALIGEVGPSRATLITFVNPAVAVTLGVALLDEPLTTGLVLGFPLVLAGCWLVARQQPSGRVTDPDPDPDVPLATPAAP